MPTEEPARGRILIVDDQEPNVRLLERILQRAGYETIESTTDPRTVPELFTTFFPDVVLLDRGCRPGGHGALR
jgi:putative two-component system response regulator